DLRALRSTPRGRRPRRGQRRPPRRDAAPEPRQRRLVPRPPAARQRLRGGRQPVSLLARQPADPHHRGHGQTHRAAARRRGPLRAAAHRRPRARVMNQPEGHRSGLTVGCGRSAVAQRRSPCRSDASYLPAGLGLATRVDRPTRRGWMPSVAGGIAAALVALAIYLGSRGLRYFDAALIGYATATVFLAFGVHYRYAVWVA